MVENFSKVWNIIAIIYNAIKFLVTGIVYLFCYQCMQVYNNAIVVSGKKQTKTRKTVQRQVQQMEL